MHDGRVHPHPRTGKPFDSPVPPGSGWPGDPASRRTPVANDPAQVVELAGQARSIRELDAMISVCRACPRLVAWREEVAVTKRKAFADQPYWGRPVPGFGAERPRLMVVALAPAAHGGNRTGRAFTGDRSGDELFAALHRAGLANAPVSVDAADGLRLKGTRVIAPVRCAPPDNVPTTVERHTCAPWLTAEWRLVGPSVRVILALGGFGWQSSLNMVRAAGVDAGRPLPKFGHAVEATLHAGRRKVVLLGCYHPSQHNTFTGRLTRPMLDEVFGRAAELAGLSR
ncbi:MAG TPA: uracil-DNA glycosylase [Mycobacterium sp.]|nr:uracil-DNA glycosylase [Mycobacterium sp.]